MSRSNANEWYLAMDAEIKSLHENNTWELVEAPAECNVISSKWIYKTKLKPDGTTDRLKARLVARGYAQRENLDYNQVFAPVLNLIL